VRFQSLVPEPKRRWYNIILVDAEHSVGLPGERA
jgi:hypothetical protein